MTFILLLLYGLPLLYYIKYILYGFFFQTCLSPFPLTTKMTVSNFTLPFLANHLWKITLCSFPYYYFQLRTPPRSSQSHFHCSLSNPYQNSSSLQCLKTLSHHTALCKVNAAFHNTQNTLLSKCILVNSHLLSIC